MPAVRARSGTPTLTPMPEPVPTLSLEPCQAVPAALLCWPPLHIHTVPAALLCGRLARVRSTTLMRIHTLHIHTLIRRRVLQPAFPFTGALALCYGVDSMSKRRMKKRRRAGR